MASAAVQINVRISPALHARLEREVARQGATTTAVVSEALDTYLKLVTPVRRRNHDQGETSK